MTEQEFSNEFDILYGNITNGQAPALDEYEKSIFLTKAQNNILRRYFNPNLDAEGNGFDGTAKRQYDFSSLIETTSLEWLPLASTSYSIVGDSNFKAYFPEDYFLSVNEFIVEKTTKTNPYVFSIVPITYSQWQQMQTKVYSYPPKRVFWRILVGAEESDTDKIPIAYLKGKLLKHDSITDDTLKSEIKYNIRYIRKPNPIILYNMATDNLSIDGKSEPSNGELPSQLHNEILEEAVTLAKVAYIAGSTSTIVNQQSRNKDKE